MIMPSPLALHGGTPAVQDKLPHWPSFDERAFSLDTENLRCDIGEFVKAAAAEGAPCWKVFWPQCHTERAFREQRAFGKSGFPFKSKEYASPASVDYSQVEVPNARWHEQHTFTCFAYPTYEPHHCEQIGAALKKVIRAYAK